MCVCVCGYVRRREEYIYIYIYILTYTHIYTCDGLAGARRNSAHGGFDKERAGCRCLHFKDYRGVGDVCDSDAATVVLVLFGSDCRGAGD